MAQVEIPSRLQERTGGASRIEIEAQNIRQLLRELDSRYPGLADELRATSAIAIDGEIIGGKVEDALLERIQPDTEVYFVPAVSGG